MLLRGDVAPARELYVAPLDAEKERAILRQTLNSRQLNAGEVGLPPQWSLIHAIGVDLHGKSKLPERTEPIQTQRFISDTGEILWEITEKDAGYFVLNSPKTRFFTGFVRGRTFELGEVLLKIGQTRLDWATVSLTAIEGEGVTQPGRILLAATGYMQNTGRENRRPGWPADYPASQLGYGTHSLRGNPRDLIVPGSAGSTSGLGTRRSRQSENAHTGQTNNLKQCQR